MTNIIQPSPFKCSPTNCNCKTKKIKLLIPDMNIPIKKVFLHPYVTPYDIRTLYSTKNIRDETKPAIANPKNCP